MNLHAVAVALALAGLGTSVAVAQGPLPDAAPPVAATSGAKIAVCHRTRSPEYQFQLRSVSRSAVERHMRHGDLLAERGARCSPP